MTTDKIDFVRLGLPLYTKTKAAANLMARGQTKLRERVQERKIDGVKRDLLIKTPSSRRSNGWLPPIGQEGEEQH